MTALDDLPAWLMPTVEQSATIYDDIPPSMRSATRWLVWRLEPNHDATKKPRKVPYYVDGHMRSGTLDSPADQARLASFDDAVRAVQTGQYTGLGFALGPDGTGNHWQGIDFDGMPNKPELQLIATDLPGYTETSPSGNGVHAIGYGRRFDTLGSNASGIEAYAAGRYFTVTGDKAGIHPPVCLAEFVESRLKPMHAKGAKGRDVARTMPSEQVSPETITDLRSALLHMRSDDRELWVRMGHALKPLGEVGRGLFMDWSATSVEKFDAADAADKWDSFTPNRTGYQAVFAEAQRQGWLNPRSHTADTFIGDLSGFQWSGNDEGTRDLDLAQEWKFVALDSLDSPHDELPHVIDLWVPRGEVTLLAGHGGSGKSYVALIAAVHVALGRPLGALTTTRENVLFFSAEDGGPVLRQRLSRICRAYQIDPNELEGRLHLIDASDIDPALHREQKQNVAGRRRTITETPLLDALAAVVEDLNAGLVVVDNASDTYDDDEIKRARVRTFVRSLRQRLARPGRAVILLAHVSKSSATAGKAAGTEDYSGSTAWHNSVRSRLSLSLAGNALTIEHMKSNLVRRADPIRMEWNDGVPMLKACLPSIEVAAAERAQRDADKAALVAIIQDFDQRGERVTTAVQGSATTFNLLKGMPTFPSRIDKHSLPPLLRELEAEGRIFRQTVKTPDRKRREVFSAAPIPPGAAD